MSASSPSSPGPEPGPRPLDPPTPRQRTAGRLAAGLVALEALVVTGFAVFYLVELALGEGQDLIVVIMSVVTMVVFVIGLGYTSLGLLRRHPRAQAPAIAFNFLMVPLGIALLPLAPWWVGSGVLVLGVAAVVSTVLMGRLEER
ncbi:hypothetical protein AVL62_06135 [Serinicoccus chungangensis]|uniref:Integral membrane protein n=1 Tax=Serinicoccus chungangensis TaxID=767452 RepID=A0A0W8IH38_9MICO|nr:hypothetical protein [Serinicoccus chungangensis]KUG59260.1 hypothetical protein AVL62_06135 [Serinicoccus chungangensis]